MNGSLVETFAKLDDMLRICSGRTLIESSEVIDFVLDVRNNITVISEQFDISELAISAS